MSLKKYLIFTIALVLSFLAGRFIFKPKPEIKEKIKYITVAAEKKKTKKTTRIIESKKPDGTIKKETVIVEDSSTEKKEKTTSKKKTEIKPTRGVLVGVYAIKNLEKFQEKPAVGLNVSVPVFGNLFITGMLDTTKRVGVGVALEF